MPQATSRSFRFPGRGRTCRPRSGVHAGRITEIGLTLPGPASSSKLRLLSFEAGSSAAAKPWTSTRHGPRLAVAALPWPGTRTASTGHLCLPGRGGTGRRGPGSMPGGKPRFRPGLRPSEAAGCRSLPSSAAISPSTIRSTRVRAYLFSVASGRTPGSASTNEPRTTHYARPFGKLCDAGSGSSA